MESAVPSGGWAALDDLDSGVQLQSCSFSDLCIPVGQRRWASPESPGFTRRLSGRAVVLRIEPAGQVSGGLAPDGHPSLTRSDFRRGVRVCL